MNILYEKRRALGYVLRCGGGGDGGGDGGGGGGESETGTPSASEVAANVAASNAAAAAAAAPAAAPAPSNESQTGTPSASEVAANVAASNAATGKTASGDTTVNGYAQTDNPKDLATSLAIDMASKGMTANEIAAAFAAPSMSSYAQPSGNSIQGYSASGIPNSAMAALAALGMGNADAGNTAGAQTVDQALAAANVGKAVPMIAQFMLASNPAARAVIGIAQTLSNVMNGMPVSDALVDAVFGSVAKSLGISTNNLSAAISGNLGQIAANTAVSALTAGLSKATGISPSAIGLGLNLSGVTGKNGLAGDIASGIQGALGNPSTGISIGGIKGAVNDALGGTSIGSAGTISPAGGIGLGNAINSDNDFNPTTSGNVISSPGAFNGTSVAPPTGGSTPTSITSTPAKTTSSAPAGGAGASTSMTGSAAGLAQLLAMDAVLNSGKQSSQPQTVDIKSYVDPFGTFNPVQAKTGGGIDDLLRLVRS